MTFQLKELVHVHLWLSHWHKASKWQNHRVQDCIYVNHKLVSPLNELKRSLLETFFHPFVIHFCQGTNKLRLN